MMSVDRATRVLIVYRSQEGQTARVAERIGSVLRAGGVRVDIEPAADRPGADPRAYDGVVIGDSIHAGRHSSALVRWLRRHRSELAGVPVAVFQVSLTSAVDDAGHRAEAQELLNDLVAEADLRPQATGLFAGALAYTRYGWLIRRLMRRIAAADGHSTDTSVDHEYTDWGAVERFAHEVELMAASSEADPADPRGGVSSEA